jgi:hypothetical protein
MKITITVDCTPEEARTFFGAPDLSAVQQQMMTAFQEQLRQQMTGDPEAAMKAWLGSGLQGFGDLQKSFWQQMTKAAEPKGD